VSARPIRRNSLLRCIETLELRRFLHAGHEHAESLVELHGMLQGLPQHDGHVSLSTFLQAYPDMASKNVWSPAVFNPTNSQNINDWLYDPHQLEDDAPTAPAEAAGGSGEAVQLPDLVPLTAGSFLDPFIDSTEIAGHNLLRFTTAIGNQGTGPAILRSANSGTPPAGSGITSWTNPDGTQNIVQQLYSYNGSNFSLDSYRPAGRMVWHSAHSHFHLEGYARYRLLTNVNGQPGPVAKRVNFDGGDAIGDKVGFCLVNINNSFTMTNGQSSTTLPGYDPVGDQSSPSNNGQPQTTCGFLQGIHVGHADVYSSIYDGQWIDVTGVPDGNYFLEVTLDALDVIQESDDANNTVLVPYTLTNNNATGGTILPDRFEPNNSFETATNLGVMGIQTQPGLTAHISGESDYFRFVAASSGNGSVQLRVAHRDVNLFLYDSNFTLMGSATSPSSGTTNNPAIETITRPFVAGQTYYVRATAFGSDLNPTTSAISNNYSLIVNINPTVEASTPDAAAGETGANPGNITLARNGPTSSGLTVNISVGGTATRGVDYEIYHLDVLVTGNTISIGNEASNSPLEIRVLPDSLVEATETVIITVGAGSGYVIGAGNSGTVQISDTPPQVTASAFAYAALPMTLAFDFSLDVSGSLALEDLTVIDRATNLPVSLAGLSYSANRGTFTIAGGALPDGNYRATLAAAGVTHAMGAPLSSNAVLDFFIYRGDANNDRTVNIADFSALAAHFNQAGNFADGDFDYSGTVDLADFSTLASRFNTTLAAARSASVPSVPAVPAKNLFARAPIGVSDDRPSLWEQTEPQGSII
jgi:hypothetical protein